MSTRSLFVACLTTAALAAFSPPLEAESICVKGSDTIGGALGPDLAEAYYSENPATPIVWESLGSGTAFVGLFDGSATLGASSRPINEAEQREAKSRGIQLREWVIGYDGIAILVHPSNPLPALTIEQASRIFQGRIRNFREVGGPDRPIELIARPSYSGTHGFFKEKVLRRGNTKGPEEFADWTSYVEHSADIVERVAAEPNGISFLGLGWVRPTVRAVPVAEGRGAPAVVASVATVRDGSYPIFRSLFVYSLGEPVGEARNLLAFVLSDAGQRLVEANGFVAADVTTKLAYRPANPVRAAGSVSASSAEGIGTRDTPSSRGAETKSESSPAPSTGSLAPSPLNVIRVHFTFGGVRITDEGELRIAEAARRLAGGSGRALVVGHADALGSKAANDRVAEARAGAVYQELRRLGVSAEQLEIGGKGADEPIDTNVTAEGRRRNRRADIVLLDNQRVGG